MTSRIERRELFQWAYILLIFFGLALSKMTEASLAKAPKDLSPVVAIAASAACPPPSVAETKHR